MNSRSKPPRFRHSSVGQEPCAPDIRAKREHATNGNGVGLLRKSFIVTPAQAGVQGRQLSELDSRFRGNDRVYHRSKSLRFRRSFVGQEPCAPDIAQGASTQPMAMELCSLKMTLVVTPAQAGVQGRQLSELDSRFRGNDRVYHRSKSLRFRRSFVGQEPCAPDIARNAKKPIMGTRIW